MGPRLPGRIPNSNGVAAPHRAESPSFDSLGWSKPRERRPRLTRSVSSSEACKAETMAPQSSSQQRRGGMHQKRTNHAGQTIAAAGICRPCGAGRAGARWLQICRSGRSSKLLTVFLN